MVSYWMISYFITVDWSNRGWIAVCLVVFPTAMQLILTFYETLSSSYLKVMSLQRTHTRPHSVKLGHPDKATALPTQVSDTLTPPLSTTVPRTDELTQAAKDRANALVEEYVPTAATEGDLRCIEERQLRHKAGSSSGSVGVPPSPCRHGFPQAFSFDPCGHKVRCQRLR